MIPKQTLGDILPAGPHKRSENPYIHLKWELRFFFFLPIRALRMFLLFSFAARRLWSLGFS